jgi:hypothetical protein
LLLLEPAVRAAAGRGLRALHLRPASPRVDPTGAGR